jgi:TPP-dependent pyruvate/acetoin dehydrogenase alpha subunit
MKTLSLYQEMLRIRLIEEEIAKRYSEQKMRCPVHLSIGQEAVAVGVSAHLTPEDYVLSTHRAHAHYLAKGGSLKSMLAEIYGKKTGCSLGRGGSMHLVDLSVGFLGSTPIVGGSLPIAVGVAFASKLKKENRLTVVYFGEGSTEEGVFMEALNFAALKELPILFVCENNLYSVYSPLEVRQNEKRDRAGIAEAHGIKTWSGDGMDVEKVYKIAGPAVEAARLGPVYLELSNYRYREHCGPNLEAERGEFKHWEALDPICSREGSELLLQEIEEAFRFAEESPFPEVLP